MRILVVSDIHSNIAAFEAVLKHCKGEYDLILNLGDLVGYGPFPNECVELAAQVCAVSLAGNHDLAALGRLPLSDFSSRARRSAIWTKSRLVDNSRNYLAGLAPSTSYGDILLCHGSPDDPVWKYIFSIAEAETGFAAGDFTVCLVGHTHFPQAFIEAGGENAPKDPEHRVKMAYGDSGSVLDIRESGFRFLLNPGSVGFPRDELDTKKVSNPSHSAARYALLDLETGLWAYKRVEYYFKSTAGKMRLAGLW